MELFHFITQHKFGLHQYSTQFTGHQYVSCSSTTQHVKAPADQKDFVCVNDNLCGKRSTFNLEEGSVVSGTHTKIVLYSAEPKKGY